MKDELSLKDVIRDVKKSNGDSDNIEVHLPYDVELLSILKDAAIITDENFVITYWNTAAENIYGWKASEVCGKDAQKVLRTKFTGFDRKDAVNEVINTGSFEHEVIQYTKDNKPVCINASVVKIKDDKGTINGYISINRDITTSKRTEVHLKKSEKKYSNLFETMVQGVLYQDSKGQITSMNTAAEKIMGYTIDEIKGRTSDDPIWDVVQEDGTEFPGELHPSMVALKTGKEVKNVVMGIKSPQKAEYTWLNIHAVPEFKVGQHKPYEVYTTFEDITKQKNAERNLQMSEERYRSLFNKMTEGFALHEIVKNNEGKPVDYRFIDINPAFEDLTGLKREDVVGKLKSEVIPEDNVDWVKIYGKVAITGESIHIDEYTENHYFDVYSFSPALNQFAVLFTDITKRKNAENQLKNAIKQLQRSNLELGEFAYVASHDLKEPLRMITSFLQLLQKRYENKLDSDADDFIGYAVDGAARMQELINDLLTYSWIDRRGKEFKVVDLEGVLQQIEKSLNIIIKENKAQITHGPLPKVTADYTQIVQLLENLIVNAIKYRGCDNPKIHISARKEKVFWIFKVEDNGIGIEKEHIERIFKIFQRLHGRNDYEGTGIGLAIAKKIIERHNGKIWVDSEPDKGSCFYFTLPLEV